MAKISVIRGLFVGLGSLSLPVLLSIPMATAVHGQDLPEGEGKDVVLKVCTPCHGVSEFSAKRLTRAEWDEKVDNMAARGARASDEEFDVIVKYLAKNFAKE
jgi:cytochrome c5